MSSRADDDAAMHQLYNIRMARAARQWRLWQ